MAKLLLVDDDIELTAALGESLEKAGWIAESVHCVADAMQILQHFVFDLIILNWDSPDGMSDFGQSKCRNRIWRSIFRRY